jgi:hypothetical protein
MDSIVQFSLYADFDSMLSIYAGDPAENNFTCWNSNDDSPVRAAQGPQSMIAQPLQAGQTYYINVHGYSKAYGMFTLESEELEPAPNDECSMAIPLELGVAVQSDTLAATGDANLTLCGE